jgi:hypothetical protein
MKTFETFRLLQVTQINEGFRMKQPVLGRRTPIW